METVYATVRQRVFANRGLVNAPLCIIYGFSGVLISVTLRGLDGIWLFVGIVIYTTVIEWIAGHLAELIYHERWWDYSDRRLNLDGYICLGASLLWGVLGFVAVKWLNTLVLQVFYLIPSLVRPVVIWTMVAILAVDVLASYMLLRGRGGRLDRWEMANNQIANVTAKLGKWIADRIDRRLHKAYPKAQKAVAAPKEKTVFAYGCGFYKVVVLFFIGAFLGDLVETVFCRFAQGYWMSRSSVVWGPFSIVWGIGIVVLTIMLHPYRHKDDRYIFLFGTVVGGVYEYGCSVFTELVFGTVFWDYSGIPFNLAGRINLLFCFFWGVAAVLWIKILYPVFSRWIEKIKIRPGKIITWVFLVFFLVDMLFSSMALSRFSERQKGIPAETVVGEWIDETFPDSLMNRVYPKAVVQK